MLFLWLCLLVLTEDQHHTLQSLVGPVEEFVEVEPCILCCQLWLRIMFCACLSLEWCQSVIKELSVLNVPVVYHYKFLCQRYCITNERFSKQIKRFYMVFVDITVIVFSFCLSCVCVCYVLFQPLCDVHVVAGE